jgi:hypothetical protein
MTTPSPSSIQFDPASHIYRLRGTKIPSVTQVLQPLESFVHVPADALEYARGRGIAVHAAMALLARDDLDWESIDSEFAPYVRAGSKFLTDSGVTVLGSELVVFSERLRCAGTVDLVVIWRAREALLDFKATAQIPPTVGPQTAGYELLYRELYGVKRRMQRYCVHLRPDDYRVIPLEDTRDESIFLSALNLFHWSEQHHAFAA